MTFGIHYIRKCVEVQVNNSRRLLLTNDGAIVCNKVDESPLSMMEFDVRTKLKIGIPERIPFKRFTLKEEGLNLLAWHNGTLEIWRGPIEPRIDSLLTLLSEQFGDGGGMK